MLMNLITFEGFIRSSLNAFETGNWNNATHEYSIILLFWILPIFATIIDYRSGIKRAKALGEKIISKGMRKSFSKYVDYWSVQLMLFIMDVVASVLPFVNLPYFSILGALAITSIEIKSVIENYKTSRSSAGKIPSMIKNIIEAATSKDAIHVIEQMNNLNLINTDKLEELTNLEQSINCNN